MTQGVGLRNPGWRRNWTCPLPRSGSVNLFKFLLFFLFSFLSLRGFSLTAWVTTSFGFWSLLNCHLPISNAFPTYQFAIKILHFYPYPPPPYSHSLPPSLLQHVPRPPHPVRLLLAPWSNRAVRSSRMWMWRTSARCQCCPHRSLPSMDSLIASEAGRRRIALWKSTRA